MPDHVLLAAHMGLPAIHPRRAPTTPRRQVHPVDEVVKNILAWVQETLKHQRRLRSATFWGYFCLRRRSREYIELIKATLRQHSLLVNIEDAEFGSEDKNE